MAVIVGTAGVGKTALAIRWSHLARTQFTDGQLYVNLRGYDPGLPATAMDVLGRFLQALDMPVARIPAGEEARMELFRSLVADRSILVVLDNAASAEQLRPLLPGGGACAVLVTSRSRMSGLVVREGAHRVSVETLSEAESIELLHRVLSGYRDDEDDDLLELSRLCAHLPLALRIAAERAAARPRMPLSELIADLRDEAGLWDALSADDATESEAVRTVFAWSYRALSPQVMRVFRLLGSHPGPEFGVAAVAALAAVHPTEARRALDTLAGAHLLEECGHDRYQFHDLLRAFAMDQAQHEEPADELVSAQHRVLRWYLHSAAEAGRSATGSYTLPVELEPLPHGVAVATFDSHRAAFAWYETERDNLMVAVRTARSLGMHRVAWQIPAVLAMIIADREPGSTWLSTQELALDSAREIDDRYGEAITLDDLGIACRHLFKLGQAAGYFEAASTTFREVGDRSGQARAVNGLGVVRIFGHHLDDALDDFQQALETARELSHRAFIGFFTRNVGWALLERSELDAAERTLREATQLLQDLGEPLEVAESLTLLASVLRQQGRAQEARDAAESALRTAGELGGKLFEGLALLELGRIAMADPDVGDALARLQEAAALFWRVGRLDLQAVAWNATGQVYVMAGRPDDAAQFCRRAVAAQRERGDRWQLALSLASLADAVELGGASAEAQTHRSEAASLLREFPDPEARAVHARVLSAMES
ncbi:NB-ARC domain-containing protein [Catenulispora rubra]|uniref:NB-ARC domain-containing protein n=1 Tax=Catenulispora rubra TaxID=280293 RepID=UPI001E4E1326|nr:tetratricopeptide repeat protein [Catenulispora rubra]